MEMHIGTDSKVRGRLVSRSEGTPSAKHPDFYWQINGANCLYVGAKRDGTTGTASIGLFPRALTFNTTAFTAWAAGAVVIAGETRSVVKSDYVYLECTIGGTTGGTEPTPAAIGQTVADNTVTWITRTRLGSTPPAIWCDQSGNVGFGTDAPEVGFEFAGGSARFAQAVINKTVTVTYSAAMQIDASAGNRFSITATNNTAFTINIPLNPTSGQEITYTIRNTSGGALGAVTWDAVFKLAAWTQPANGYSRSITYSYDGTNWLEISRTPADVPN
jgi:hypothetical protein